MSPGSGAVALSRIDSGQPEVLDYIDYSAVRSGRSFGSFPDGQPFQRLEFFYATPGGTNNAVSAPLNVFINEWMASNTGFLADPADGHFDDWFEIYNPGPGPADLGGYFLSDDLVTNRFKFRIPSGYSIPPGGHLLVWADNDAKQNSANNPDLHVSFKLSAAGDEIGLFAGEGTVIDSVRFGSQTGDVSQGRYPDGSANIIFLATPTPRAANIGPQTNTPPQLSQVMLSGPLLTLGWQTVPGHTYRVEYKNDLRDLAWTPLGSDMPASSGSLSVSTDVTGAPRRFYRILLVH